MHRENETEAEKHMKIQSPTEKVRRTVTCKPTKKQQKKDKQKVKKQKETY